MLVYPSTASGKVVIRPGGLGDQSGNYITSDVPTPEYTGD